MCFDSRVQKARLAGGVRGTRVARVGGDGRRGEGARADRVESSARLLWPRLRGA